MLMVMHAGGPAVRSCSFHGRTFRDTPPDQRRQFRGQPFCIMPAVTGFMKRKDKSLYVW